MNDGWSREEFARDQSLVLRRVAEGAPIREVLDALARLIERLDPSMKCSILLLTDDGRHLVSGAAPSLPGEYTQAIDGLQIGESAGSCGAAAFVRETVIAADIATDPRWEKYRSLALPHGLRSCWSTPVFGNTGRVLGTFAVYHLEPHHPTESQLALVREATDVARIAMEQSKNERTLRQSEERYRTLVSATAQAVWIFTSEGTMIGRHSTWPAFTGVTAEESSGVGWLHSIHPDDREATRMAWVRAVATRAAYEIEHRVRRADGEWRTMRGHAVPIFGEDGSIREWIGAHTDVTEQRALEAKLRQAQKLESLGVMAGGIAHDFNNLLVGILANAGLALTDVPVDSPAHESLVAIEEAASRAADFVGQLLAYTGRGGFHVQQLDLSRLVLEMGGLLSTAIPKHATVDYDFAADLLPIRADVTQIRQVVMNLITNAAEALDQTRGTIRVSVSNADGGGELPEGRYVALEVTDSGCGMDAATQARMFEPFFTTKFAGRGLGLAAVQGIVRSHGGVIRIRSKPGEGTTFRVLLPADTTGGVPKEITAPPTVLPARLTGKGTVLVADDEETVRSTSKRLIERAGYKVLLARNGVEAIEVYDAHAEEIVAVLLDLTMPVLGGDAVVEELLGREPRPRIILSSGFSDEETSKRFIDKGLAGFLQKPYRANDLFAALARCIAES